MLRVDRSNLFDLVRLYAALQVLLHHGAAHLGFELPKWLEAFFVFPGVPIFFALSGFLVSISWLNRSSEVGWRSYAVSRSLRIFPALWAAALFGWLIALFCGKASFALSPLGIGWLVGQSSFFTFFNPDQLRDLGVGVMNGSLWTIPVELEFYLLIPIVLTFVPWLSRRSHALVVLIVLIAVVVASFYLQDFLGSVVRAGDGRTEGQGPLFFKLLKVSVIPYLGQFLIGASFVVLFKRLGQDRASLVLVCSGVILGVLAKLLGLHGLSLIVLSNFSLAASFVGIGLIRTGLRLPADISYGLYLYHMPALNLLLIVFGGKVSPIVVSMYLFISFVLSVASWVFLEKPCISMRKRLA
jgi:peptidoglycan/LPS O-acetylase OafA/YrhL